MIKPKFQIIYFYCYYFRIEIYLRISRSDRNVETNRGIPSLSFVATLNGVDLLHASWSFLQPVPGTLSTCRYSAPGHHVDFMRFYSHNYRTALQKSVVFVVDRQDYRPLVRVINLITIYILALFFFFGSTFLRFIKLSVSKHLIIILICLQILQYILISLIYIIIMFHVTLTISLYIQFTTKYVQ